MSVNSPLRVPCAYQGGKQRVSAQIVDLLIESAPASDALFYDLCCGSGAIAVELVNRGIEPSRISMLDLSSWGAFWAAIASGSFDMCAFDQILSELPSEKRDIKSHLSALAELPVGDHEAELYLVLQACSFGGKQIWRNGTRWANACFRDYWEPTATSIRRSPANPMQPGPIELRRRVALLASRMRGVTSMRKDVMEMLTKPFPSNAVVYIDPPYHGTTGYAFGFDVMSFVARYREINSAPLFVSEGVPLGKSTVLLTFGGAKGGISGVKKGRHQEWLSQI